MLLCGWYILYILSPDILISSISQPYVCRSSFHKTISKPKEGSKEGSQGISFEKEKYRERVLGTLETVSLPFLFPYSIDLHAYFPLRICPSSKSRVNMTARQSSPTSENSHSDANVRKRVCKACDRCRLKKSKVRRTETSFNPPQCSDVRSVMVPVPVVGVGQIMPSACLASAKRPMIKYTPKGKLTLTYDFVFIC